ncbi:hypothetical protein [Bacillus sp. V2I10]|uniref:hypothetical protein n=1 Tax=Bacillus sp. V2I10 TaxID=3042276 RepID=UPI0027880A46|nr:hypothetical protein [Bacillus sp. V2I10]MDQ0861598.1 hypothetical protein [Bacillus sp. V2I10]
MNREENGPRNYKDELAEFILESLDINYREGFSVDNLDEISELDLEQDSAFVYLFD